MLLEPRTYVEAESSTALRVGSFSLVEDAALYEMLSSKLYAHKEKASIRETCCNAADANLVAGNGNLPIMVHAPSKDEPFFSVQDFGKGLSADECLFMLSAYGFSDKRRNEFTTGCYGMGSKSPFAYLMSFSESPSFTVLSVHAGRRLLVTYAFNETGIPVPRLMSDEPAGADEKTGLTVQFECNIEKLDDFNAALYDVLQWFKSPVQILNGAPVVPCHENVFKRFGAVTMLEKPFTNRFDSMSIYGVMSNVAYPINLDALPSELSNALYPFQHMSTVYLDLPDNSVDMPISRESVDYTPRTVEALTEALKGIREAFQEQFSAYDTAPNIWEQVLDDLPWLTRFFASDAPCDSLFKGTETAKPVDPRFPIKVQKSVPPAQLQRIDSKTILGYQWTDSVTTRNCFYQNTALAGMTSEAVANLRIMTYNGRTVLRVKPNTAAFGLNRVNPPTSLKAKRVRLVFLDETAAGQARSVCVKLMDGICKGFLTVFMYPAKDVRTEYAAAAAQEYFEKYFKDQPLLQGIKLELLSEIAPELVPRKIEAKKKSALSFPVVYDTDKDMFLGRHDVSSAEDLEGFSHYIAVGCRPKVRVLKDADKASESYVSTEPELTNRVKSLCALLAKHGKPTKKVAILIASSGNAPSNVYHEYFSEHIGFQRHVPALKKLKNLYQDVGASCWSHIRSSFSGAAISRAMANLSLSVGIRMEPSVVSKHVGLHQASLGNVIHHVTSLERATECAWAPDLSDKNSFLPLMLKALHSPEVEAEALELEKWLASEASTLHDIAISPLGTLHTRVLYVNFRHRAGHTTPILADAMGDYFPVACLGDPEKLQRMALRMQGTGKRKAMPTAEAKAVFTAVLAMMPQPASTKKGRIWSELDALHNLMQDRAKALCVTNAEQDVL